MTGAVASFVIAVGVTSALCYALITRAQNRARRGLRSASGADAGCTVNDGFSLASWFGHDACQSPLDNSGSPIDPGGVDFGVGGDGGAGDGGGDDGGGGD